MTRALQQTSGVSWTIEVAAVLACFLPAARAADTQPESLEAALSRQATGLKPEVLRLALKARELAWKRGQGDALKRLTVIDYSLPSTRKRLWVLDLAERRVLFHELVAHGRGSGDNVATAFSNRSGSLQSSLGLFLTGETYSGKHGYTLRLQGLEPGINDRAEERAIVIHGAWYVSEEFASRHGRLGRSWGCPALDRKVSRKLIDAIKGGSLLFVYYPDRSWLKGSKYLE